MGKSKKSENVQQAEESHDDSSLKSPVKASWEDKIKYLSPIATPLASKKLTRKLYKLVNKANANNSLLKGIKQVQKSLRKGQKGIIVLAGDVSPLDIISHIPVVCEESNVPYCYTPSKSELAGAYSSNRQVCMVLIKEHEAYKDDFQECKSKIEEMPSAY